MRKKQKTWVPTIVPKVLQITVGFLPSVFLKISDLPSVFSGFFQKSNFHFSPEAKIFDFSHLKLWNCNIRFALWQKRNGAWILKFSRSYRTEKSKFRSNLCFPATPIYRRFFYRRFFPKSQIYRRFFMENRR